MKQIEVEEKKVEITGVLTEWLLVLRSSLNITQEQLACVVGISRQTYSALETQKKEMTWNVFLALLFFFLSNDNSRNLLEKKNGYIQDIMKIMKVN